MALESYMVREWAINEIIFVSSMGDQLRNTLNNRGKLNAGEALHKLAYYDTLTGLQNRAAFLKMQKGRSVYRLEINKSMLLFILI